MASLMKQIMDIFDDLSKEALKENKYLSAQVFTNAESLANNCHGLSPQEMRERLSAAFTKNKERAESEAEEVEAWNTALEYLELLL